MSVSAPSQAKVRADLADVRRRLEQLAAEGRVDDLIELVFSLLVELTDKNTALSARLATALRALYGRKSQKVTAEQLALLFAELGAGAPQGAADASSQPGPEQPEQGDVPLPADPPKPPPRRGGRRRLPDGLPRDIRIVPVPEAERTCSVCGAEKTCIGHRVSEILEFVPAQFRVIEERREKLACPSHPEEGVVTAASEKVMERGRPGPGLLANVVIEKFDDAMPLYRQTQQYERCGVWISPSTLGDWAAFALDVLAPVSDRLAERAFGASYLQCDDTGMRVLDRDHPNGVKRGHIWAFAGNGVVVYRYAPDWAAKHPAALLKAFNGHLQGDGYAGYGAMLRDDSSGDLIVPDERRLGCGMHIRAKFERAAKANDARAAVALSYFKAIYRIEAACKDEELSEEGRLARRQELSIPIVDDLYGWIHELHPSLVPSTPLHAATTYALNQEALWRRCFTDGRFEIDNGEVERQLRRVALGRKNYLFAGSDKGAERLAVGYTVLGTCRKYGVNALMWLTDVIAKLQGGWPRSRLDELLPDVWPTHRASEAAAANGGDAVAAAARDAAG